MNSGGSRAAARRDGHGRNRPRHSARSAASRARRPRHSSTAGPRGHSRADAARRNREAGQLGCVLPCPQARARALSASISAVMAPFRSVRAKGGIARRGRSARLSERPARRAGRSAGSTRRIDDVGDEPNARRIGECDQRDDVGQSRRAGSGRTRAARSVKLKISPRRKRAASASRRSGSAGSAASDTSGTCRSPAARESKLPWRACSKKPANSGSELPSSLIGVAPQQQDAVVGIGEAADQPDLGILHLRGPASPRSCRTASTTCSTPSR